MKLITATSDATQQALQTYVNQWCTANHTPTQPVILHETPVLDSTRDAIDWLADHDDPTGFHAVRYRDEHSAPLGPSDRELAVNRELEELRGRLEQRNEPYWAHHADDATDGMVTCPHCHSTLNTAYCGTRKKLAQPVPRLPHRPTPTTSARPIQPMEPRIPTIARRTRPTPLRTPPPGQLARPTRRNRTRGGEHHASLTTAASPDATHTLADCLRQTGVRETTEK